MFTNLMLMADPKFKCVGIGIIRGYNCDSIVLHLSMLMSLGTSFFKFKFTFHKTNRRLIALLKKLVKRSQYLIGTLLKRLIYTFQWSKKNITHSYQFVQNCKGTTNEHFRSFFQFKVSKKPLNPTRQVTQIYNKGVCFTQFLAQNFKGCFFFFSINQHYVPL